MKHDERAQAGLSWLMIGQHIWCCYEYGNVPSGSIKCGFLN